MFSATLATQNIDKYATCGTMWSITFQNMVQRLRDQRLHMLAHVCILATIKCQLQTPHHTPAEKQTSKT